MTLDLPPAGDRRDFHVSLHERHFAILDTICARHQTSRAKVIGALLERYAEDAALAARSAHDNEGNSD